MMTTALSTLLSRHIEKSDGEAVADILNAYFADIGRIRHFTGDGVRSRLQTPDFNCETHTRLIFTENGTPIAYAFLWNHERSANDGRLIWVVHPDYRETKAGSILLDWAERQFRHDIVVSTPETTHVLQTESLSAHDGSRELYEQFRYHAVRYFWEMKIELTTPLLVPMLPRNIRIRSFDPDRDAEALYRVLSLVFAEHWGYRYESFEVGFSKFNHEIENDPHFDPANWFLMVDRDEIIGMALCTQSTDSIEGTSAYISRFGIMRQFRQQGLGFALLQHVFRLFFQQGCTSILLDVDAENESGATRLYERAGMKIDNQWRVYEKVISKG